MNLLNPYRYGSTALETRGAPAGTITTGNSAASQSFSFWSPVDLLVSQLPWDLYQAGTYELRIGGTLVNTRVIATPGMDVDMMAGASPFLITASGASLVEVKLTKTAGSGGWRYVSNFNGYVNDWFHASDWAELAPNEGVPARMVALRSSPFRLHAPIATSSSSSYGSIAFDITWASEVEARGVSFGSPARALYRISVDGVTVGTSPTAVGGSSLTPSGLAAWIPFDSAFVFDAGVSYAIEIVRTTAGGISCAYKAGPTHSDALISLQTAWTEPIGSVIACVGWDLTQW